MIKLKKLIKEHAWDRKFGEPLPTLEDVAEKHQIEEKETQKLNEMEYPKPKKITTLSELIKYGKGRSFAIPTVVEIHVGNRKKSGAIVSTDSGDRLIIK